MRAAAKQIFVSSAVFLAALLVRKVVQQIEHDVLDHAAQTAGAGVLFLGPLRDQL